MRSRQRLRIDERLAEFAESLTEKADRQIDGLSLAQMPKIRTFHAEKITPLLTDAVTTKLQKMARELELDAAATLDDGNLSESFEKNPLIIAGVGGLLFSYAPLAALPFAAPLAVTGGVTFLGFSTAAFSPVIFGAIAAGAVALTFGGRKLRQASVDKLRTTYKTVGARQDRRQRAWRRGR